MNEQHFKETERTLLYISEARERAEKSARGIARDQAEPHLVSALKETEAELLALHRKLMQRTYFARPKQQVAL